MPKELLDKAIALVLSRVSQKEIGISHKKAGEWSEMSKPENTHDNESTLLDNGVKDMESAVASAKMLLTEQQSQYTEDLFDRLDEAQTVSQEMLRFEFSI